MQWCHSPHDKGVLAVSSTSSGRQLRKPDDHTCWGSETVPPTDDEQQNTDAAWQQLKRPEHSTSLGTGEHIHWDTGVPSHLPYTWQWSSVWSSWDRLRSNFHVPWPHEPLHSVLAAACLSWPWAQPRKLRYSNRRGTSECVNVCHSRVLVDWTQDTSKLTKMVETSGADIGGMLLKIEVWWDDYSQHTNMLTCKNSICTES